ncbi:DUF6266 family protein [Pedobacter sp. MC2016-14]|uniref:DUF6266 family protein n=1 Tax=Pedobacter sp. MC2016-14 TaxID=2897327 RepID=UPI001E612587|nr:DUF6266 family protein [Pedobacter sp. MC2016-14]MCD0490556.1 DUF6266 family protein [Pedobacter sp. MC2016-14]
MAILVKGIFGHVKNKAGALVGYSRNGKNVIRAHARKQPKLMTRKQEVHRSRFGLIPKFLSPLSQLIAANFKTRKKGRTPMNAAVAYNYKNAMVLEAERYAIDYAKVVYARGTLDAGYAIAVEGKENMAIFHWRSDCCAKDERVNFVVYNPAKDLFMVDADVVLKSAYTYSMRIPEYFNGDVLYCYLNFKCATGAKVSDSSYAGQFVAGTF